jgi:putative tricarboxylic transport membrane protein
LLDAFFTGLWLVFQWPAIGYLVLGVLLGVWLGAVPGLGGITGLVLLLPFTFSMEPIPALALLLGVYAVTSTGDSISSILLGIPGTAASQATILDGYPMARRGEAERALGAALTASAYGGVFGAVVLALSLPVLLPFILMFTNAELFMLSVLGLVMVGALSGSSIAKGLASAALGLMLGFVGYARTLAVPRFDFGASYLLDGIPLAAAILGLFGISELLDLAVRNTSISQVPEARAGRNQLLQGMRDVQTNFWLATRSSALGTYIGFIPGLGSSIVDWLAYGHAVQSASDASQFGRGDVRGVIAPEAANNAIRGGGLIPMVAFGVPGSVAVAILMGAMLIQGLRPGPQMLTADLPITFSIIWSLVMASILASALLLVGTRWIARIAFVPGHLIVPAVVVFVFMGSWLGSASMGDWLVCLGMGVLGFVMKRAGWPRPPLVLAFVLCPILETTFLISMAGHRGFGWLARPMVLIILALIVISLATAIWRGWRGWRNSEVASKRPTIGEGVQGNLLVSVGFGLVLLAGFAIAWGQTGDWPLSVRRFPLIAIAVGAGAVMTVLVAEVWRLSRPRTAELSVRGQWVSLAGDVTTWHSIQFLSYLAVLVVLGVLIGQKMALTAFVLVYMLRWGRYGVTWSLIYAAGCWAFLILFYDRLMHIFWYPSVLGTALYSEWPTWLPRWLFF